MLSTGICRRLDELGRIVVPKELRKTMGIAIKDSMEIFVNSNQIVLKKYQPGCVFCGQIEKGQQDFRGYTICLECKSELQHVTDNRAIAAGIS